MLQAILDVTSTNLQLPGRNKFFIPHEDRGMCVHQWGNPCNPLFLYLHGAGMTGSEFHPVADGLSEAFNVVALDYAGHGDSSPLQSPPSKRFINAEIDTVLNHFNAQKIIIQSSSLGGIYAAHYAKTREKRVLAMILTDSLPGMQKGILTNSRRYLERISKIPICSQRELNRKYIKIITKNSGRSALLYSILPDLFENTEGCLPPKFDQNILPLVEERVFRSSWADFENISQPALLLLGGKSKHLKPSAIERFSKRSTRISIATIPEAGHNIVIDNPDEALEQIVSFLENLPLR